MLSRIIDKGLVKSKRKTFVDTIIADKPGTLGKLLSSLAETGANVLSVTHNRSTKDVPIGFAKIELELETIDEEHIQKIKQVIAHTISN